MRSSYPTLKEISAEAGVSIALVSVVLNGKKGRIMASEQTRAKILAVAKSLGYEPNRNARGLRMQRSFLIGVSVYNISSSFVPEILSGIESEFLHTSYSMLLGAHRNHDELCERLEVFRRRRVDGVILISTNHRVCEEYLGQFPDFPAVTIGCAPDLPHCSSVMSDRHEIGSIAAAALVARGHCNIGYLCNDYGNSGGFQDYLNLYRQQQCNCFRLECKNYFDVGVDAAVKLLTAHPEISAVFADSDVLGAAAIQAAVKLGRQVPQDLAVLGVDDSMLCRLTVPQLSSINQPKREQGSAAARILMQMLDGGKVEHIAFPGKLVCRESLGDIKSL